MIWSKINIGVILFWILSRNTPVFLKTMCIIMLYKRYIVGVAHNHVKLKSKRPGHRANRFIGFWLNIRFLVASIVSYVSMCDHMCGHNNLYRIYFSCYLTYNFWWRHNGVITKIRNFSYGPVHVQTNKVSYVWSQSHVSYMVLSLFDL